MLVAALEAKGWSVWWDREVSTGEEFDRAIETALDSAGAVVVIWTPTSVESRWVRGEARVGADRGVLIPVRFDGARLPIDARAIHTTDLDGWNGDTGSEAFLNLELSLTNLLDRPAAGAVTPEPQSERRRLTVLSCNLSRKGSAARLDPEEWHAPAAQFRGAVGEAATRFGGHLVRASGDNLMIFFGYPIAQEDAAERAARAGLAIIETLAEKKARSGAPAIDLAVRIGVHAGTVVVSHAGADVEMFGEAPDLAARVRELAEPNTVMITGAVRDLIAGLFVVEDKGALPTEVDDEPTPLFKVVSAGFASRHVRGFAAREPTPFVGREDETYLLLSRWKRVREGAGQLVLLTGEPGIGKTRLMEVFLSRIVNDPHLRIEGSGSPFFANTPLHAVTQLLDLGLGWRGDESPQARVASLERSLEPSGMRFEQAVPLIAELLGLPIPDRYPPLNLPAAEKRKRLLACLAGWVFGATRSQPLVIVLEDLHWVDPSTLELLQTLVEQGATAPLLLLCTARPEFKPPWPSRAHHTQIALVRLNSQETRELVVGVFDRAGIDKGVIDAVITRTDGVPLFAEELSRLILDRHGSAGEHEIPTTLHDSLAARLDRLGPAKAVAQVGAVLGREFSYALLAAVSETPEHLLRAGLSRLADAELIYVRGHAPEASYQFKHALIQDVAYQSLLRSQRRELHAHIALTITEKFPALAEAEPQVLGRHWSEAGDAAKASTAWGKAAADAQARHAFTEAAESYRQAIASLSTLPDTPERDARELELGVSYGMVLHTTKGSASPESAAVVARNTVLSEKIGGPTQLAERRFATFAGAMMEGNWTQSGMVADQLLDIAERVGAEADESAVGYRRRLAHNALLLSSYYRGDIDVAEEHFARWTSLSRYSAGPERYRLVPALCHGGICARHLGLPDLGRRRLADANARARESQDPWEIAFAQSQEALLHVFLRDPGQVEASSAHALTIGKERDLGQIVGLTLPCLGWAQAHQGRAREGVGLIRDGIAKLHELGTRVSLPLFLALRAEAEALDGKVTDALGSYEEALMFNPEELVYRPQILVARGELHFELGHSELAEEDFRNVITFARQRSAKGFELRATVGLAGLLKARGDPSSASEMLARLYGWFTEGFDTVDMKEAKALLDDLA